MNGDRELGMDAPITRRDFMDGVAMAVGGAILLAGTASAATMFPQDRSGYDPPTLTGMRGSHDGSYDYAHTLRDGNFWKSAGAPVEVTPVDSWSVGMAGQMFRGAETLHVLTPTDSSITTPVRVECP